MQHRSGAAPSVHGHRARALYDAPAATIIIWVALQWRMALNKFDNRMVHWPTMEMAPRPAKNDATKHAMNITTFGSLWSWTQRLEDFGVAHSNHNAWLVMQLSSTLSGFWVLSSWSGAWHTRLFEPMRARKLHEFFTCTWRLLANTRNCRMEVPKTSIFKMFWFLEPFGTLIFEFRYITLLTQYRE